jgi:hypothetical protein
VGGTDFNISNCLVSWTPLEQLAFSGSFRGMIGAAGQQRFLGTSYIRDILAGLYGYTSRPRFPGEG